MKLSASCRLVVLLLAAALAAQGSVIATFTDVLTSTDPTMTGRISRDGVSSDWSGPKTFPGLTATTTTYNYTEYFFDILCNGNYFQIDYNDPNGAVFFSAYVDGFAPAPGPTSIQYLGDAGSSGAGSFQVYVPDGHRLDVVVNNVPLLVNGFSPSFDVMVEEFTDSEYTDLPEPASIALTLGGLAAFVLARRRHADNKVSKPIQEVAGL